MQAGSLSSRINRQTPIIQTDYNPAPALASPIQIFDTLKGYIWKKNKFLKREEFAIHMLIVVLERADAKRMTLFIGTAEE